MFSIRTLSGIVPALTFSLMLVGCSTESETPADSAPPAPAAAESTPAPAPAPTPAAESPEAKPETPAAKEESAPPAIEAPKVEPPAKDEAAKSAAVQLSPAELAEIKKLANPADQAAAIKQAICPISGGHLGDPDMGAPVKVSAEGQSFFICCKGCEKEALANAKDILAKLAK